MELDHVTIRAWDLQATRNFFQAVVRRIGAVAFSTIAEITRLANDPFAPKAVVLIGATSNDRRPPPSLMTLPAATGGKSSRDGYSAPAH
jgi:hypothetical protein